MEQKKYITFMHGEIPCIATIVKEYARSGRITVANPCFVFFQIGQDESGRVRGGVNIQPWVHNIMFPNGSNGNLWTISPDAINNCDSINPNFLPLYETAVAMTSDHSIFTENTEVEVPAQADETANK